MHSSDDAAARKWKPPPSPLVAAGIAKPLDRYTCLFQPTQPASLIPAVGACNRCGHLGHAGSLCRADTMSTALRFLRLALPPQPTTLAGPAATPPIAGAQARSCAVSQEQLREILLAASLTPALQATHEPARGSSVEQPAPPNPLPSPELEALREDLQRQRRQIADLQAQLTLREQAVAHAPELLQQQSAATAAAAVAEERARMEACLAQQREQQREQVDSISAQLSQAAHVIEQLEQRAARAEQAAAAMSDSDGWRTVGAGTMPAEAMSRAEFEALQQRLLEADVRTRKAEAEAATLKRQADLAAVALASERSNAEAAARRHKQAIAAARAERDAASDSVAATTGSGEKRRHEATVPIPPQGFAASLSTPGTFVSLTKIATSGNVISSSAVRAAVALAIEHSPPMSAAVNGLGRGSPLRKSQLLAKVTGLLMQRSEHELDALLVDTPSLAAEATQCLVAAVCEAEKASEAAVRAKLGVSAPARTAQAPAAAPGPRKQARHVSHPLARHSPGAAPRGNAGAALAGGASADAAGESLDHPLAPPTAEADAPMAPPAAGAGGRRL